MSRYKTLGTEEENVYISPFSTGHIIRHNEELLQATPEKPIPNHSGYPAFPDPNINYTLPRPEPTSSQPPAQIINRTTYGTSERVYKSLRYYGNGPY